LGRHENSSEGQRWKYDPSCSPSTILAKGQPSAVKDEVLSSSLTNVDGNELRAFHTEVIGTLQKGKFRREMCRRLATDLNRDGKEMRRVISIQMKRL
jgi:hypothetical protein